MSNKLKKLVIKGLRGATGESTLEFAQDKKITMIFGENGTGKSTIVDAFSFVCDNDIGSVHERSGTTVNHAIAVGIAKEDVRVALETESGTFTAKFDGSTPRTSPETGFPSLRILRRSSVLRLVEAKPAERFNELRNFIALSAIETSETTLREAVRSTNSNLQHSINTLTEATGTLESYWQKEDSPSESAIKWAEEETSIDISRLEEEKKEIRDLKSVLENLKHDHARISGSETTIETAKKADESAREQLEKEAEKVSGQSSTLLTLLQSANNFINQTDDLNECPVCEQSVDKKLLSERIEQRMAAMSVLKTAASTSERTKRALASAEDAHKRLIQIVAQKAIPAASSFKTQSFKCLVDIELDTEVLEITDEKDNKAIVLQVKPLVDLIDHIVSKLDARTEEIQASITKRTAIVTLLEQITQNSKKQESLDRVLKGLNAALTIVETKRKEFVDQVLEEISEEVDRLYQRIHPHESIGGLTLSLKPRVRGSLLLRAEFYSKQVIPPQAYFSESHLDTLGLCIFLALAKKYKTEVIILDDVVTSVDSSHLKRIIDLIDEESDHFEHVILTTHYRPWREQYRYHRTANTKISFVELRFWSLENGIHVLTNKLAIEELAFSLKPEHFDRQISAQKAGIILESLLNTLSVKYGTKVPNKKPPDYTLGELLSSLSRLSRHIKVERFDEEGALVEEIHIREKFEAVFNLAWIRNKVGAHFNFDGLDVSDTEVLEFGTATLDLAKTLICPHSGSIPHKNNGSCWVSRGGLTKLHPLTQPS